MTSPNYRAIIFKRPPLKGLLFRVMFFVLPFVDLVTTEKLPDRE